MYVYGRLLYKPSHTHILSELNSSRTTAHPVCSLPSKQQTHPGVRPDGHWNRSHSEEHVTLLFFFVNHLVVLIDDGYGEEDTSPTANGTEEVGNNRQQTNAHSTKCCSSWDVPH